MADFRDAHQMMTKLQFHYWFGDKSHTMDALVYNKCERELLELAKAAAKLCGVPIKMETEPSGKGGIKTWLTLIARSPKKTPAGKMVLLNALVVASVVRGTHATTAEATNGVLNALGAGGEMSEDQHTKWGEDLAQMKAAVAQLAPLLDESAVVKKRRSNFYSLLGKYKKVKAVSVALTDDAKKLITEETLIDREQFKTFVVKSAETTRQLIEGAQVEIISPVLVKGNLKWKGLYQGAAISFAMKSDDFMVLVQSGKVEFKSGSTIACRLEIEKKITITGAERVVGYNILGVESYSENGKTIETNETKTKQKPPVVSKRQLDLFG